MPDLWRPALADFVQAAAVILDIDPDRIQRLPGLRLAESALQAPFSGVGDQDAYSEVSERAAVLIEHLARNHPLPDGNKRVSFALMILFLERNGQRWGDPDDDRDVHMVEQIASGQAHRSEVLEWITSRLT